MSDTDLKIDTDDVALACFINCAVRDYTRRRVAEYQNYIDALLRRADVQGVPEDVAPAVRALTIARDECFTYGRRTEAVLDATIDRISTR